MKGWREIPIGGIHRGPGAIKKIWYNHAIIPLWGAMGLASVVCGGFLMKYFAGHTEISWSKSMRATYDHQVRCARPAHARRACARSSACATPPPPATMWTDWLCRCCVCRA